MWWHLDTAGVQTRAPPRQTLPVPIARTQSCKARHPALARHANRYPRSVTQWRWRGRHGNRDVCAHHIPTLGFSRCATFECWHTAGAQTNAASRNRRLCKPAYLRHHMAATGYGRLKHPCLHCHRALAHSGSVNKCALWQHGSHGVPANRQAQVSIRPSPGSRRECEQVSQGHRVVALGNRCRNRSTQVWTIMA